MAIQVRRGNEVDFDPNKMRPGEWAVSLDTKYVRMCFSPGICLRMATYEAFEADMAEIHNILTEAQTIQEAVARIQTEINDTAIVVEDYAILSKSYAVGGTGTRENENADNAKYYYEQAKHISQGGNGLVPLGTIAFENLPTEDILTNAMYNISNDFTSDERFLDGGGILYGKGSNVFYTADGKWDVLAASDVKGVKGEAEDTFRQGNVTISAENIGLGTVKQDIVDLDANVEDLQGQIDTVNSNLIVMNFIDYNHSALSDANNGEIGVLQYINESTVNGVGTHAYLETVGSWTDYKFQVAKGMVQNFIKFRYYDSSTFTWSEWEEVVTKNYLSNQIKHVTITKTAGTGNGVGLIHIPMSEYPNAKAIIPLGYCTSAIYKISAYKNSNASFILLAQKATDNAWADSVSITFEAYVFY